MNTGQNPLIAIVTIHHCPEFRGVWTRRACMRYTADILPAWAVMDPCLSFDLRRQR
ncbi:hypothetical protein [Mariprofundus ferrooxydans]|uniref:hypothetical protein n=1 Tax=Mariprofundus ferrooxydans TaxID=314344 RepID=UPI0002E8AF20|nr:hypothetical protein [Mariprofundus ferrooxydans]